LGCVIRQPHRKGNALRFSSTSSTLTLITCPTLTTVCGPFKNLSANAAMSFLKEIVVFPSMSEDFADDRMKKEAHLTKS
jgi:hypothetical protein